MYTLGALILGFGIDLLIGDPARLPHPVIFIGKLISAVQKLVRALFPKTLWGERIAGAVLWLVVVTISTLLPLLLLWAAYSLHVLLGFVLETVFCWQILATKSLKDESMKVYQALQTGDIEKSRYAVSMIVGRDTAELREQDICRATVETVAENTSDGIVAPMLFLAIGGVPLGILYKAINTMDSMLGYVEPPYKNIGLVPAKMDDAANFIPARLSAFLMLAAGFFLRLDVKSGWRIFRRDRFNHASPNSAQTESTCAGLLGLRLAGDACYHGVLHKKKYIGDAKRDIENEDIPCACRLLYVTAFLSLLFCAALRLCLVL